MKIIAVIPHYKMPEELNVLLETLQHDSYDNIYVLDDNSHMDICKVTDRYPDCVVITGEKNLGPGGNRNRVLGKLESDDIIHFIDADMIPLSENNAVAIRNIDWNNRYGFVAGRVLSGKTTIHPFSYGEAPTLINTLFFGLVYVPIVRHNNAVTNFLGRLFANKLEHYPVSETLESEETKSIFWGSEANLIIPYNVFSEIGGYPTDIRYHEIQVLGDTLKKLGYLPIVVPKIAMLHSDAKVRGSHRTTKSNLHFLKVINRLGILRYIFGKI